MNSKVSTSLSGVKALFTLAVALVALVLVNAQFVHALEPSAPSSPAVIMANVQAPADVSMSQTPASVSYFDGINVASIAVAAYDH